MKAPPPPPILAFVLLGLGFCGGCLPIPHTTERSPEVRGRVLDARTHAPIAGAKVFLTYWPGHSCKTDTNGYFLLNATHNLHLLAGADGDWPNAKYDDKVTTSHTNYLPTELYGLDSRGDVLLEPEQ